MSLEPSHTCTGSFNYTWACNSTSTSTSTSTSRCYHYNSNTIPSSAIWVALTNLCWVCINSRPPRS